MTETAESRYRGVGVSNGVVVGRVLRTHTGTRDAYRTRIEETELEREFRRFHAAVRLARRQLLAIKEKAEKELGKDHAYIFDAHLLMLEDEKLINDVDNYIREERSNAEWALKVVSDRLLSVYAEMKDEYLRERGSDIEDVVQRLLVALRGERPAHRKLSESAVIVSEDLLPSTIAELDLDYARAVATDAGGWTSHMAIIARGLGIPAVVGLRDFYRRARTGDPIIVDADRSEVILNPSPRTIEQYRSETHATSEAPARKSQPVTGPATTDDGVEVVLRANVELPAEFASVREYGASGVGLYRSEFLLSGNQVTPSEEEQYGAYLEVARMAGAEGAVVRLFDLGALSRREAAPDGERNPALGLRAIRFGLKFETVMRTQVRAILRAASEGNLSILLPMVADVADVNRAKRIIEEEWRDLSSKGHRIPEVRVGAMIEIPSAVITAEKIARAVDFFELGTNDLVQYTLAVDRGNEEVADWFRTLHPAVLFGIHRTLNAAAATGIPAIVCGEMASTPAYAILLIGLGAVDLSMTPAAIPRIRRVLSHISSVEAQRIALHCLNCETADQVEEVVTREFHQLWPKVFPPENLPGSQ